MPKLRQWVESRLEGACLNMFGGVVRLPQAAHNEINLTLDADMRRDAYELEQWQDLHQAYDTVIFDPPYSAHQAVVSYNAKKQQQVSHARDVVEYVLRPGGRVISLGFNSTGMSASRGFEKEGILLVNCGGSHNDFLIVCERQRVN